MRLVELDVSAGSLGATRVPSWEVVVVEADPLDDVVHAASATDNTMTAGTSFRMSKWYARSRFRP